MKKLVLILFMVCFLSFITISQTYAADHQNGYWTWTDTGWKYYDENGNTLNGWQNLNGYTYLFNSDGGYTIGWYYNDEGYHYFNDEGHMLISWQTINGKRYYFNNRGIITKGWLTQNGKKYYFNNEGHMLTGTVTIDGKIRYFKSNGELGLGWQWTETGWKYFDNNGNTLNDWQSLNGYTYLFKPDGGYTIGWYYNDEGYHYFNKEGHMLIGWQTVNGKRYYFNNRGVITKGWLTQNSHQYYFNSEGHMLTGYQVIGGKEYNFGSNGMKQNGWCNTSNGRKYFDSNGNTVKGWQSINGNTYYFDNNGIMTTGWYQNSDGMHYFGNDGAMYVGTQIIDGITYHFDDRGICPMGWITQNGKKVLYNSYGEYITGADALVIDISKWNGDIDWDTIKREGLVDKVILRCGYYDFSGNGSIFESNKIVIDSKFKKNADALERLGIPYGVYFFSYGTNVAEARVEAQATLQLIQGRKLSLPVFYDLEYTDAAGSISASTYTQMANEYCQIISNAGYTPGIYANLNYWNTKLYDSSLNKYEKWVAQYGHKSEPIIKNCTYKGTYRMWQYTSSGSINGIKGRVDLNAYFSSKKTGPTN